MKIQAQCRCVRDCDIIIIISIFIMYLTNVSGPLSRLSPRQTEMLTLDFCALVLFQSLKINSIP